MHELQEEYLVVVRYDVKSYGDDPDIKPMTNRNKADYNQNHNSTSINHFYEKLLLLKDMINTETAKKMAMHRQTVMEDFLEEFMAEWEGEK